jgi:hypothetical protein
MVIRLLLLPGVHPAISRGCPRGYQKMAGSGGAAGEPAVVAERPTNVTGSDPVPLPELGMQVTVTAVPAMAAAVLAPPGRGISVR